MKFKEKQVDHFLYVNAKLPKDLFVNESEFARFMEKPMRGFFRVKCVKKDTLEFFGPMSVSLFTRLQSPINRFDFFFIVEQILDSAIKMQDKRFMWNKVLWDVNHVYFNPSTKEVKLLFFPLTSGLPENGNIKVLLWSIAQMTKPCDEKDPYFLVNFYNFLKEQSSFDPRVIENYIYRVEKQAVSITKGHKGFSGNIGNPLEKPETAQVNRYVEPVPFKGTSNSAASPNAMAANADDLPTGILENNAVGAFVLPTPFETPAASAAPAANPVYDPTVSAGVEDDDLPTGMLEDNAAAPFVPATVVTEAEPYVEPAAQPAFVPTASAGVEDDDLPTGMLEDNDAAPFVPATVVTEAEPYVEPAAQPAFVPTVSAGVEDDDLPTGMLEDNAAAPFAPVTVVTEAEPYVEPAAQPDPEPLMHEGEGSEETSLLVPESDPNETTLLVDEDVPQIVYPKLERLSTGEEIQINKPVFRIGKEKSYVDYFVNNNSAVSRSHADIVCRGQHYYIVDLNSKNRTFINGHVVPVRCETEIYNGDRLKLANEEFTFTV